MEHIGSFHSLRKWKWDNFEGESFGEEGLLIFGDLIEGEGIDMDVLFVETIDQDRFMW